MGYTLIKHQSSVDAIGLRLDYCSLVRGLGEDLDGLESYSESVGHFQASAHFDRISGLKATYTSLQDLTPKKNNDRNTVQNH